MLKVDLMCHNSFSLGGISVNECATGLCDSVLDECKNNLEKVMDAYKLFSFPEGDSYYIVAEMDLFSFESKDNPSVMYYYCTTSEKILKAERIVEPFDTEDGILNHLTLSNIKLISVDELKDEIDYEDLKKQFENYYNDKCSSIEEELQSLNKIFKKAIEKKYKTQYLFN